HERALRSLLIAGAPASEAARQAIEADLFGDAQAIETLTSAGRSALREGAVQAGRRYLDAAPRLAGDRAPAALQIDLAKALLASGAGNTATALLDRILAGPGVPVLTRFSAQLLLGQAAFHGGAVQRTRGLFDAVATKAGRNHPKMALKTLLDH